MLIEIAQVPVGATLGQMELQGSDTNLHRIEHHVQRPEVTVEQIAEREAVLILAETIAGRRSMVFQAAARK
jgi:hypothetical protein